MKKVLLVLALILTLSAACLAFTACGEDDGISFKTFEVNGTDVYGRVPNDQTTFNFANEVEVSENAEYVVSLDISGIQTAMTKIVELEIGDNIFYVVETIDDETTAVYTVVIHRSDVFYEVSFNVEGVTIETQYVENGYFANEPTCNTEISLGYELLGWNFDFTKPINGNVIINAEIEVSDEMKNFEFTSTTTTCEITGPKDKHATEIIIPDCVTSIDRLAFAGCTSLTSVTIGNSVTSIGDSAFTECTSLTSVTIPDSVTSIGMGAFAGCTSLTSMTIPDSVTSIGGGAFAGCTSLTGIIVDEDNEAYKSIVGNLYSKDGKTLIQYAAGKTNISFNIPDSVISIGDFVFYDCASLRNVTIPDSVISIGDGAFYGCASLRNVTIPDGITNIGLSVFAGCTSLTSVTIPDGVKSIGREAFWGCTSLTSVTIGNSVTDIGYSAFSGCTSLTSVTIPDSVTSIGNLAFYNCTRLAIYCKAASQPSGWSSDWNTSNRPVVWGYKG